MSYGGVENIPEDLDFLEGGTITSIAIVPPEEQGLEEELIPYAHEAIVMVVRLKHPVVDGETEKECTLATFQVWQDVEGNGPGYLSLVGLGT